MNADAIKDFLFRHFEKFIFGALTLLALFLIYQGVQKPDILAKYQPEKMEQRAIQVKNSIEDDHWVAINEKSSRLPTFSIVEKTKDVTRPVVPAPYTLDIWEPKPILSVVEKRTDPKLPVPLDLQVKGVLASLAMKSTGEYPVKLLEPADPVKKDEKRPVRPPKPTRASGRAAMMGMDGGMGMDSGMMGMDDGSMSGEMMGDMGAMGGMPAVPAGPAVRPIDALLYDQGYRSTGMSAKESPITGWFIAGVALMPQKEIYDAYEKAFAKADGYVPMRDQPYYLGYQLQRADVTTKPVEQLAEEDWKLRSNSTYIQQLLLKRWAGMAKEIVTGKYRDVELTSAIPPVLLDHYAWFAAHPKIPLGDELLAGAPVTTDPVDVGTDPLLPVDSDTIIKKGRAGVSSGTGYDGMSDLGGGGYGGMNDYGMGQKVEQPEFKLIRFYDFHDFTGNDKTSPQPGRKYVYRVRVIVEDPNFPSSVANQPRTSTLSSEVFKRVEKLTAASLELAKANPLNSRVPSMYSMYSEYSAPSPAVSLPGLFETFAGPVEPAAVKTYPSGANSTIEFQSKQPKAKVVVTAWSPQYGTRIPIFQDVMRGTVVDKEGTFDVPDPLAMVVKKLPDEKVKTANVVLDIFGGRPLGISPAEDQTEPGLLLMFDPSGGLEVVDEIETQRSYRLYSFADEREKP